MSYYLPSPHIYANVKSVGQHVPSASFASGSKENVCISTRSTHTQSKINLCDVSI